MNAKTMLGLAVAAAATLGAAEAVSAASLMPSSTTRLRFSRQWMPWSGRQFGFDASGGFYGDDLGSQGYRRPYRAVRRPGRPPGRPTVPRPAQTRPAARTPSRTAPRSGR